MGYVAGKPIQVQKADGTVEVRQPGEAVPEAASWRNLDAWIAQKRIVMVPDEPKAKAKAAKAEPAAPAPAAELPAHTEPVTIEEEGTPAKAKPKRKPAK